ncbi:nuclear protein UL24 [Mandrillus leucophaeus cytomegalovirus]|uniref:Nuclear protein UL24 n=1 Tax=Mandrillus leucophaeus cytomegalovirus TaxID=1654930 RepID=A0A0G2UGJ9_9BETA|nr:nuclear protein UL24 [Mandrillus leucophaeus cytomegalovirus]AKI29770.1 nuclear protein UL24 [Mandrillus leucophaeus cytomegalovirus]
MSVRSGVITSLDALPSFCKRNGQRKHLDIYRRMLRAFPSFVAFNRLLGGLFPAYCQNYRRWLFFEVRLTQRIPDCVLVFVSPDAPRRALCYVIEFKTTCSDADGQSVREHATHNLQYVQGLKQLKGALTDFDALKVPRGDSWAIIPTIIFFQQQATRPSLARAFRSAPFTLRTDSVIDYLKRRQDESVTTLLSATHRRLRTSRRQHPPMSSPRAAKAGGRLRRGAEQRGSGRQSSAKAVPARGAQRAQRQSADLLRRSGNARVRGGGAAQTTVRGRTAAVPRASRAARKGAL